MATSLDVTRAFVTTRIQWQESTDLLLILSGLNGLKKASLVRLSKLATIDSTLVQGRLGELDKNQLQAIHQNLRLLLQL